MFDHLDHVGVLVRDIDQALPYYVGHLGLAVTHEEIVPAASVRLVYLDAGNTLIQLLEPTAGGPIKDALDRQGEGLHHVCYAVADIDAAVRQLAPNAGVRIIMGGRGRRAAFLPPGPHGMLTELTEVEPYGGQTNEGGS